VTYYRRGPWRRFARRYGWRAYALPALAVFTMIVIADPNVVAKTTSAAPATHVTSVKHQPAHHAPAQQAPPQQFVLGSDSTPCTQNPTGRVVLVSIKVQRAWMCSGRTQVYSTLVTTGAENVGDGTPLGTWHVQDKQTNRYLVGPGYRDYVKYWMPFDGDFGFHDASWQTMPYGSSGYKANGSHGCIHLPLPAMKWFFSWADTNTAVTIQA
jgi:lipoprotein-anchoring transpeptidase ErfK/SrfK